MRSLSSDEPRIGKTRRYEFAQVRAAIAIQDSGEEYVVVRWCHPERRGEVEAVRRMIVALAIWPDGPLRQEIGYAPISVPVKD